VGTTFDQYPAHPAITECRKDVFRSKVPIGSGQPKKLDAGDRSCGFSFSGHQDATGTVLVKDPRLATEATVRIDDDPGRLRAGNPPHGYVMIVDYRSTDADNNRVDQCPQPVEVGQSGRPVDVFRMP